MKDKLIHFAVSTYYVGILATLANMWGAIDPAFDSELARFISCIGMTMGLNIIYKTYKFRKWLAEEERKTLERMGQIHFKMLNALIMKHGGDMDKVQEELEKQGWTITKQTLDGESTIDKP